MVSAEAMASADEHRVGALPVRGFSLDRAVAGSGVALDLQPDWRVLFCGTAAIAAISFLFLDSRFAFASTLLGGLMVYGADVDARLFLLPDLVTLGGILSGLVTNALLDPWDHPWMVVGTSIARAIGLAFLLEALRRTYGIVRGREGLGFGDVKLAATIGVWLPLDAIPPCFALAAGAGLSCAWIARLRGAELHDGTKLPFGLFLCPALWLVYFVGVLSLRL
jgi:leader peptidase (prepilin peptidase) / N-methyltransferase